MEVDGVSYDVALRKESVDRNFERAGYKKNYLESLSARRAWIEIRLSWFLFAVSDCRSPQGERG